MKIALNINPLISPDRRGAFYCIIVAPARERNSIVPKNEYGAFRRSETNKSILLRGLAGTTYLFPTNLACTRLPFHEAWPEVQAQLRPLHEAILNGTSGAYFAEDLLIKVQRRGIPEWEDARFTLSYSPVPDETAPTGVGGVLVTVVETTSRVRTEEALRASEERFAGIFRQTAVGVIQCELDAHSSSSTSGFARLPDARRTSLAVA